nr:MAG TPA: minor capsid protein [Caudoviricetes sp.]
MYQDLEDWILQDIANRLLKSGDLSGTADRELWKLEQMGLHRQEIIKRLSQLTGKSRNEIRRLLQDSAMTSFSNDSEVLEKVAQVVPLLQNNDVIQALNAELTKTMGELGNLTRTTMMQSQRDLLNMLNEVDFRVASGLQSYSSAICEVLDRYAESGVMVNYPTGSRRSLEAAVRCCIVTSMNQTAAEVTNQYIIQHGVEYVVVSQHLGARYNPKDPTGVSSHDWWQGKAYKIHGSEPGFPNLLESTGYDIDFDAKRGVCVNMLGLHGYNCRHSHGPWYKELGESLPEIDREESQKRYDLEQKQRAFERAVRKTKRQLLVKEQELNTFPDDGNIRGDYDKLAYRLRMQNQKYGEFCAENNLQKQYDRVKVAGFKKPQAAKANGRATAYKNEQYASYEANLGKNMVSKSEFTRIMSDRSEKKLFTHYSEAVKRGDVSPLVDYGMYRKTAMELQDKCVGLVTSNGVKLEKRSLHSIDRVIGSVEQRRSGITVDDVVKALTSPETEIRPVRYSGTSASQKFIYKNAEVTINPVTMTLIQVNPHHREK